MDDEDRRILYELKGGFESFMQNHWPHLREDVREVHARLWWVLGTVILGTGLAIAGLFLR